MPEPFPHDPTETSGSATASKEERSRLRQRIHRDPGDTAARAELAQLHRDAGHADQAGRWGLLVPGWTTPAERRAFAVWVVRSGRHDSDHVLRLLSVPQSRRASPGPLDPERALRHFALVVAEELRVHRLATETDPVGWLLATPLLIVPAVVVGALVGALFSGITLVSGGPLDEPGQPDWFPTSWGEIWLDVGLGTAVLAVVAMLLSVAALLPRVPAVRHHRAHLRRRDRDRRRAADRRAARPGA